MQNHYLSAIIVLFLAMTNPTLTLAQSVKAQNAQILKPYLAVRAISELEWELLQFNLSWHDSFIESVEYLKSYPAGFDYKAMRFQTSISVHDKRHYNDSEPFSGLPEPERKAILQGTVDHFVKLLAHSFPEVKNNPHLIFVKFKFHQIGDSTLTAKYENGLLSMPE